jgi:regulator of sigma D
MNPQDLIKILKAQHRVLQADLLSAQGFSGSTDANRFEKTLSFLAKFRVDLNEHIKLENDKFYPGYIKKQIERGEEVESTKLFIKKMDEIAMVIMAFLDKYLAAGDIEKNLFNFKKELSGIIGTLNTRIETEEEGLFDLYLLL